MKGNYLRSGVSEIFIEFYIIDEGLMWNSIQRF